MKSPVIKALIEQARLLDAQIQDLETANPNVSHSRTQANRPHKRQWQRLVHIRGCLDQVLVSVYGVER